MDDKKLLEAYPNLTIQDLENAWNYYHNNYREIDRCNYLTLAPTGVELFRPRIQIFLYL